MSGTITLTFGNVAENHAGMQKIGIPYDSGLTKDDLRNIRKFFTDKGFECKLYHLHDLIKDFAHDYEKAYLLVVKRGISGLLDGTGFGVDDLMFEQNQLDKDKKAFMRGKVVNKKARYNLCFSDFDQQSDFANKKGTIIDFARLPVLNSMRIAIATMDNNPKLANLQCEGNYYYDIKKTYIGFHGDGEREIVIGCRLGESFPLHYQWFKNWEKVGERFEIELEHGDLYVMSDKAVGRDWKKKPSSYTIRHAAGLVGNITKN